MAGEGRVAIFGAGGFGREVAPLVDRSGGPPVFVSDEPEHQGMRVNDLDVIGFEDLCGPNERDRAVIIAVADGAGRRRIAERCAEHGLRLGSVRAATHVSYDDVQLGEGAVLCEHSVITSNVRIGRCFHANLFSYVAHDCVIGDFVTFAPRVSCNGRVEIEDDVYVGTGALLRPGTGDQPLRIGRGAVVGMGAVVTHDVAAGTVVVGNPARPMAGRSP